MNLWNSEIVYAEQMPLTAENIDALSSKLQEILKETGITQQMQTKAWLSSDALLVNWLETYQPAEPLLKVTITKQWGRYYLRYALAGEAHDPLQDSNEFGIPVVYKNLFTSYQSEWTIAPAYSYADGENVIKIALPRKKVPTLVKTLIALVAAVATYFLCQILPVEVVVFLSKSLFKPVGDLIIGLLKMFTSIMIFTSIVMGITNLGDASMLSKQGRRIVLHIQKRNFLWTALAFVGCALYYGVSWGGDVSYTALLAQLVNILVSIVPVNIFTSFLKGDTLQILFAGVAVGVFILTAKEETSSLLKIIGELNFMVMKLLTAICSLVPYLVYLSFSQLLLNGYASKLGSVVELFLLVYGSIILFTVVRFLYVCKNLKISALELGKYSLPAFSLGFMASSALATIAELKSVFSEKLHIRQSLADFALPVMIITAKAASGLHTTILTFCMADAFGIQLSLPVLFSGFFLVALLCSSTPPVPGGIFANYALVFAFFGLPKEALAVPLSVDIIFSMLRTGSNVILFITEALYLDRKLK